METLPGGIFLLLCTGKHTYCGTGKHTYCTAVPGGIPSPGKHTTGKSVREHLSTVASISVYWQAHVWQAYISSSSYFLWQAHPYFEVSLGTVNTTVALHRSFITNATLSNSRNACSSKDNMITYIYEGFYAPRNYFHMTERTYVSKFILTRAERPTEKQGNI